MSEKKQMSPKTKKILNIVVDVVVAIVLAFALMLAICTISSRKKGYKDYTEIFGKAYLAVQSDSMKCDYETQEVKDDNFKTGDLITIKIISAKDAKQLKVGDIITFEDSKILDDKRLLNTHRIQTINLKEDGSIDTIITHGDNNPQGATETVLVEDIVGVYQGSAGGIGHLFLFMSSTAGFFVCIVLPSLLVVAYCVVNLILVIKKEKKAQTATAAEEEAAERERIRQELLAEMQANGAVSKTESEHGESSQQEQPEKEPETDNSAAEGEDKKAD